MISSLRLLSGLSPLILLAMFQAGLVFGVAPGKGGLSPVKIAAPGESIGEAPPPPASKPDAKPSKTPRKNATPIAEPGASFRELLEKKTEGGKYSVLPRDMVTTTSQQWREGLKRSVRNSPYQDMSLPDLIGIAQERNFDLLNSGRSVKKAKSSYRAAQAEFIPFANLLASAAYSDSKANAGPTLKKVRQLDYMGGFDITQNLPTGGSIVAGADVTRTKTTNEIPNAPDLTTKDYTGGADVSFNQPLLRGGGFDVGLADVRNSRLDEMDAELDDYIRRRDVALNVIDLFFQIAITMSNTEVSLSALEVKEKFIHDAEIRYEAGQVIPNEISKAEVQYNNEKLNFIKLEQKRKDQTQTLLETLGLPMDTPITFREITGSLLDSSLAGLPGEEDAIPEAVSNRPELLRSDIQIRQNEIALVVAKNDALPNLDLSASYSDSEVSPELAQALNLDKHRTWAGGVALSVPLPNIQRKEARRRAQLDVENAKTSREIQQRSIVKEVGSLIRELERSDESITLLRKTVEQAEFNLKQETELFIYGERTSNQVRDAQNDYFQAQADYNTELYTYQFALARVYRALGRALF